MKTKSLLSVFLAFVMCISLMTVTAFASTNNEAVVNETEKTVTVSTVEQFLDVSSYSNSDSDTRAYPRTFAGWTVVIANDLDMAGKTWQPLVNFNGNMKGTLKDDGTAPIISNLSVSVSEKAGLCANSATGLFSDLTIADSSFTNTNKTSGAYAGAFSADGFTSSFMNCDVVNTTVAGVRFVGGITGSSYGNITDCDVTECVIEASTNIFSRRYYGDNIGGIVGLLCEGNMTIYNCTVSGTTVTGRRQVGGIAGAALYGNTITGCTVTDTGIVANGTTSSADPTATACAGGFVGQFASQTAGQPITVTNNTIEGTSSVSGAIAGWAVGDISSRATEGSTYTVSNNCDISTSLSEIGY